MGGDWDEETPTTPEFDSERFHNPSARRLAELEVEISNLKAQLAKEHAEKANLILEKAKLALEINRLRGGLFASPKKG